VPNWNKRFVASHVGDMKKHGPPTDGDKQSRSPDQGAKERVKTNRAGNAGLSGTPAVIALAGFLHSHSRLVEWI
jgi:hypothetical protein